MTINLVVVLIISGLSLALSSFAQIAGRFPIDGSIPKDFSSAYFPSDFHWGASSSAYQYEGETNKGGRGPCLWDTFIKKYPDRIKDGSNANVAVDFYHRYEDDINRLKDLKMNAFRFSISWSRVIPTGNVSEGVNEEGIKFYKNLIDYLLKKGVVPYASLFHFDTPEALEVKYGGFLKPDIVPDFQAFAELCFQRFGDKIKHWVTFNEPYTFAIYGYDYGAMAPARCSPWVSKNCTGGDSGTEPYKVAYNILNAHAAAVNIYRKKYQASQGGKIGIVLNSNWMEPYTNSSEDVVASQEGMDFMLGWFLHPVTYGYYPTSMHRRVGRRLPPFTGQQSLLLKESYDFLGLNYYSSNYAKYANNPLNQSRLRASNDSGVDLPTTRGHQLIGPPGASASLNIVPWGIRKLLVYIKYTYKDPEIHITENGVDTYDDGKNLTLNQAINDSIRKEYYRHHIWSVYRAMKEQNVKVKAFLLWSLLDNFEWASGQANRFGIVYVDYTKNLTRYNKDSAKWIKEEFLKKAK